MVEEMSNNSDELRDGFITQLEGVRFVSNGTSPHIVISNTAKTFALSDCTTWPIAPMLSNTTLQIDEVLPTLKKPNEQLREQLKNLPHNRKRMRF